MGTSSPISSESDSCEWRSFFLKAAKFHCRRVLGPCCFLISTVQERSPHYRGESSQPFTKDILGYRVDIHLTMVVNDLSIEMMVDLTKPLAIYSWFIPLVVGKSPLIFLQSLHWTSLSHHLQLCINPYDMSTSQVLLLKCLALIDELSTFPDYSWSNPYYLSSKYHFCSWNPHFSCKFESVSLQVETPFSVFNPNFC